MQVQTNELRNIKLLNDIISEHYLPAQKVKIRILLEKYGIFEILNNCAYYLKEELEAKKNTKAPLAILSATTSNLLIGVNSQVALIANGKEKKKIKKVIAEIALKMLFSILTRFPEEALEIFQTIKETMSSLAKQRYYDFADIDTLLDFDAISQMIKSISGQKAVEGITLIKTTNVSKLVWTQRVPLELLSYEIRKRKWLKSERKLWHLFADNSNEVIVQWDMRFKWHIAYLLYILKKDDYVRTIVTKGFYKIVQDQSTFDGKSLPKDTLKRLASNVRNDPKRYHDIIESVNEVIGKLTPKSKQQRDD